MTVVNTQCGEGEGGGGGVVTLFDPIVLLSV